ncbi:Enoyl-CoA delta isomerase 2, mitochondrial [Trichinella pseudospiralis]|uniref:Enoyl-CoA delta isomerase 2, mitochondrial n=1 Tax=Trichinella pseudospiralis TaxID=6337 RepID=A0A0V0Y495_TRIPS|nr:Enoyl-CoA delta isomerase 2, mitochondrial [Trichinella pseudospiralis]
MVIGLLVAMRTWDTDGTFKVVPQWCQQLFTIHAFVAALINKAAVLMANINRQTIICDFETALIPAIQGYFLNTRVQCCYFYVCKAVHKKVGELGDEAKTKYIECVETLIGEPLSNDANLPNDNVVHENSTLQAETMPEKEKYSCSRKVLLEDKGKIFRIQFNRPEKKNALTHEMYRDIISGLKAAEKSEAFITVLEGKGDYFCSGNDLNNFLRFCWYFYQLSCIAGSYGEW